jgi:hypothetical protein
MKKTILIIATSLAVLVIISAIFKASPVPKATKNLKDSTVTENSKAPTWSYDTLKNQMGESTIMASIQSTNKVNLEFPYQGGSVGRLIIKKLPKGELNIMYRVSNGQINIDIIEGTNIRVKYDDEKPKTYNMSSSSDNSSDVLFFNGESNVLTKLKNSKKVVVEVPFFQNGNQQFTFNTENLKW